MENLPSDILREILDFLDPSWDDYSIATHWIRMPKHYKHSENQRDISDFARLRLVCKRFSTLGASYLFRCVVQRFNRQSFRRLECLSEHPELGSHVKKFVYLMPYLYVKGQKDFETFKSEGPHLCRDSITRRIFDDDQFIYPHIYAEQQDILRSSYDLHVLKKAMKSFSSLQRVTILQTAGHVDLALRRLAYSSAATLQYQLHHQLQHQEQSTHVWDYVYCSWAPASQRVVETLLQALQYGNSGVKSFVCPMISPQGLVGINHNIQKVALGGVWKQLTHLELSFDDKELSMNLLHPVNGRDQNNLDERILLLSEMFLRDLFSTAENLSTILLGFDPNRPLNIPLEAVFHNMSWLKLKCLGLNSWRLSASEILSFVKRHRKTLRGLRLENIRLRDGDLWRDVVIALKMNARELQVVSLGGCGYEKEFDKRKQDALVMGTNPNILGGIGGGPSGFGHLAGDDGWLDELSMALGIEVDDSSVSDTDESLGRSIDDDHEVVVVDDDEHGGLIGPGQSHNVAYMSSSSNVLDAELGGMRSGPYSLGVGDIDEESILADNGQTTTFVQRRRWEQWIVSGGNGKTNILRGEGGIVEINSGKGKCKS